MDGRLDAPSLRGHLGTTFRIATPDGVAEAESRLDEVADLAAAPGAPRQDPFRLLFSLPPGTVAGQGTYLVSGAGLDEEPIFLVPVGIDGDGRPQLEAIFN